MGIELHCLSNVREIESRPTLVGWENKLLRKGFSQAIIILAKSQCH